VHEFADDVFAYLWEMTKIYFNQMYLVEVSFALDLNQIVYLFSQI
jgi:hypothetical protein